MAVAPDFRPLPLRRTGGDPPTFSGILYTLYLHTGEVLGFPGKLLMDVSAVAFVFLAISGIYMWYVPWRYRLYKRWNLPRPKQRSQLLGWFSRNHNSIGIWTSPVVILVGVTGLLITIPIVMVLSDVAVGKKWAPGMQGGSPWQHEIHSAIYDEHRNSIIIAADGFWEAPASFSQPFQPLENAPTASVMGVNTFQQDPSGDYIVGSFGGLFRWNREDDAIEELGAPKEPANPNIPVRGFMATGYFSDPRGRQWGLNFRSGLKCFTAESNDYAMPAVVADDGRISLRLMLHYLHNNRIWSMLSRGNRILVALVGALLTLLVIITGIIDWVALPRRRKEDNATVPG
jgi:hypothetical protein